jgi:hypothetical protein
VLCVVVAKFYRLAEYAPQQDSGTIGYGAGLVYKWCTGLGLDRGRFVGSRDRSEILGDDMRHWCPAPMGSGEYRHLLWLGDFSHDCQGLDAGAVARVVGDEREVVFEGGRGDPGVGYSYRASFATRAVGCFGPPEA